MDPPRRSAPGLTPRGRRTRNPMAHMAEDELEPLITECPSCGTRFRVTEAQLQRARGRVRCGACLTVFDGVEHLTLESARVYADEDQARQDLDDILDELAGGPAGQEPESEPPGGRPAATLEEAAPAATPPFRPAYRAPIFAGFEDAEPPAAEPDIARTFEIVGEAPAADEESAADEAPAADEKPAADEAPAAEKEPAADEESAANENPPADKKPPDGEKPAPNHAPAPTLTTPGEPVEPPSAPGAGAAAPGEAASAPASAPADAPDAAPDREPVVFGERPARRPLVWVGIVVGVLLLVGQVLWYQFDDWSTDARWRPVYGSLCRVLGCELPQQQDRSLLATRNLAVRTHPTEPDKLLVNAMIVNEAEFAQPFPVLELRFTTVRGMLVAGRRYQPDEYLDGDAAGLSLIPPRTPVQVELTIDDPGPEAVNYFLRFR